MADNNEVKNCRCGHEVQNQSKQIEQESFAMQLLKESNKNAKRWFIAFCVILFCWLSTIGLFVWYLNQYDFISEEYTVKITEARGGEVSALTQIEY